MNSNIIQLSILLIFSCLGLINQHYYVITGSVNIIYRSIFQIISLVALIITFFTSTNTYYAIIGILYSIAFLLLSFLRKGISKKAFIGARGDYCELSKVNNVKLIKNSTNLQVIYSYHFGESYMYFDLDDCDKLICVLREFISDDKLNIDFSINH